MVDGQLNNLRDVAAHAIWHLQVAGFSHAEICELMAGLTPDSVRELGELGSQLAPKFCATRCELLPLCPYCRRCAELDRGAGLLR